MSITDETPTGLFALSLDARLFESSPDCVKLLDCDGQVLAMNESGLCAMEIDEFAKFRGEPWKSFWPEDSHGQIDAAIASAVLGHTGHFQAFCPTAKGTPRWWDVVVSQVSDAGSGRPGLLAVSRDVTDIHLAQNELRASEARLRAFVAATSAITWHCSPTGGFDVQQPDWAEFTGQPIVAYRNDGWLDAVHPDDRSATGAAWARARQSGAAFRLEHRLRRADGVYRHMSAKVVPITDATGVLVEWVGAHADITGDIEAAAERERLAREVLAANDRMGDIVRQAPAFICVLRGPQHVFEVTNDRYLQLIGNRNVLGLPIREALPEISGQGYFELLDKVYETGEPFAGIDLPVMLQREPGSPLEERFMDLVYMALRDADGKITGLLAHGVDQTDRKQAELALHASRERFEKLVSQAATGVVEMDLAGRIVFANGRYADMLGYTCDELVGMSAIDLTAPASIGATRDLMATLLNDGDGAIIDKHYLHKDGRIVPATSSLNGLRDPDGAFGGMVAIVLDMTDNERAANELRTSEERYRTLFESMDQGFCIIDVMFDAAGQPVNYHHIEMNRMFEQHTGLVGAAGKTALELMPDLDRFWIDTYGKVALTGEAVRLENEVATLQRWFDVYATRIGGAGSTHVAVLFTDITARKHAGDTLRKLAADLSQADRRKTEFLATLAHELRNPLAPIRHGLSVIRMSGGKPGVSEKVHAMMERQVGHMVHLIDDLLDIARISGGKLQLKKARVELGQVIASAVETSMPVIDAGRHALHVDVPQEGFGADVDATRIAQVVANLLNNAAKYTPPGGTITLQMCRDGQDAVVTVADTGIGIPQDALASVFEMFSQIGSSIDRAQGGLGIGLSLVRRLVEMHAGSVTAASAGHGSTFTLRLPLATPRAVPIVDDNGDSAVSVRYAKTAPAVPDCS